MSRCLVGGGGSVWERSSFDGYLELRDDSLGSVGNHDDVEAVFGEETRLDSLVFLSGGLGVLRCGFESEWSVFLVVGEALVVKVSSAAALEFLVVLVCEGAISDWCSLLLPGGGDGSSVGEGAGRGGSFGSEA